jgi:hypothetical protein
MRSLCESQQAFDAAVLAADGDLWTAPMPIGNATAALIKIVKTGVISAGTLTLTTGPDATDLLTVDHANAVIDAHTASVQKLVRNLNKFLQLTMSSWSAAGGSVSITVTLLHMKDGADSFSEGKEVMAAVVKGADGALWLTPLPIGPNVACLVHIVKTGAIAGGTLTLTTGADPAALASVDHASNPIDCHTASVQKYISGLNMYLQATVSSWSGAGSIAVTITLLGLRSGG